MKLLEVFRDFEIEVVGASQHGRYRALYMVVPKKNSEPLTMEKLEQYIERLRQKYPQRHFYLRKYKNYVVLSQLTVIAPKGVHGEIKHIRKIIGKYQKLKLSSPVHEYLIYKLKQRLSQLHRQIKVKKDVVPIYFDLENQKIFVPKSYVKSKPKLVNYILMRTLGALGLTTTKYIATIGRG